ncbi:nucleotide-binding protein [Paenibacillus sonchi]|uniref:Nucleotide-binding protein n=1 Tax=Paenibacillus sonchi TaxID=373687 RepID=A0A974SDF4_9BACL|nr:TIR domain-containing protein [Paenibacillus sonchi]QQZ61166.1 nucleotide-binding protein [Paenibacillus sonchi]
MTNRKVRVFIGSSREATDYARALTTQLEYDAEVSPWFAGTFGANSYTMEALEAELDSNDFAAFLFAPDDVAKIRGKYVFITRDNTIFETGLFWGRLGRKRVFAIVPREVAERDDLIKGENVSDFHILSDLSGLTLVHYVPRQSDTKYEAALTTAVSAIKQAIKHEGFYVDPRIKIFEKQGILSYFWHYNKNLPEIELEERYSAFAIGLRNGLVVPAPFQVKGAAIWKKDENDKIKQVAGDVGKGKEYGLKDNEGLEEHEQKIMVVEVFNTGRYDFYDVQGFAQESVLCYPLDRIKTHVASVHIGGIASLTPEEMAGIVTGNGELLRTVMNMIGGVFK